MLKRQKFQKGDILWVPLTLFLFFFDYQSLYRQDRETFLKIMKDVMARGAYIMQKDLANFEANLAAYTGAKYAVGVANATDGLHMALIAGGICPDDEVIFCSHTMVATASAIYFAGGKPVPVEAGADHLIAPSAIEAAITPRTKAIIPTQLNGRTCNMDAIQSIASKYGLQIYEDAAQALGSKFKGKSAGTFGVGACISFYPAKNLGCLGDGGAVLTNDEDIYQKLLLLRDHGRGKNGNVVVWGFNSRLDNLQAAILNYRLANYQETIDRRRAIASLYDERLKDIEQLALPPAPDSDPAHFDVFQNYEIEAERRDELKASLSSNGIGTLIQWGGMAVHQFLKLGFTQTLPFTERLFKRMLMLPMNESLTDNNLHRICNLIIDFYRSH